MRFKNYEEAQNRIDLVNKLDNMWMSEISNEVLEVIENNKSIFDAIEQEVIRLLGTPAYIDVALEEPDFNAVEVVDEVYDNDKLFMEAINNVLNRHQEFRTNNMRIGYGMIDFLV